MSFTRVSIALVVGALAWSANEGRAQNATDAGVRKALIEKRKLNPMPEAIERRDRSNARLKQRGIPVATTLPVIETVAEAKVRTADVVAKRAIALAIVAVKGETNDDALVQKVIEQIGDRADFTPAERQLLANKSPSPQERAKCTWRYEALNVMLWSIGFVNTLDTPTDIIDVPAVVGILRNNGRAGLLAKARLRAHSELLDQADLIYRINWATTDARINGRPPPGGLNASVVYERHYALNWLIGYLGQAWDDITTDT